MLRMLTTLMLYCALLAFHSSCQSWSIRRKEANNGKSESVCILIHFPQANASVKKIAAGNKRLFEALMKSFMVTFVKRSVKGKIGLLICQVFKGLVLSFLGKSPLSNWLSTLLVVAVFIASALYLKTQAASQQILLNSGFNQYVVDGVILLTICNLLSIVSEWMYLVSLLVSRKG